MHAPFSDLAKSQIDRPSSDPAVLQVGAIRSVERADDGLSVTFSIVLTNGRRYRLQLPREMLDSFADAAQALAGRSPVANLSASLTASL